MTSKDHWKHLKDKPDLATNNSADVYSNLTLNKNHKCIPTFVQGSSNNAKIGKTKGSNFDVIEKTTSQKDSISMKKSYKNLPKDYFNSNLNDGKKESKTEKGPNKSKNASTLSLHIAAYENFVETQANDSFDGKELRNKGATTKVLKNREQQSAGSFLNDQLEFPRQQEDENTTSEVQQFAASQRLFAPKQDPFSSSVVSSGSLIPKPQKNMPKPTSSLLPPPPPPPIITLDDDDEDEGQKEDGELSDETAQETKSARKKSKKPKKAGKEEITDTPAESSDIELVGDDIFDIDDDGADDDGFGGTMNIDDDEVFKKMQQAAGINNDDIDISLNIAETPKVTRGQGTCFNCMGPHTLQECTIPHDRRKINANRRSYGSVRKDRITERTESKYVPGKLSEEAQKALNLYDDEYPHWIYKMREMGPFEGYPPGYLKRFKPSEKRLSFYCDDPNLTNEVAKTAIQFDKEKLVFYDGFNLIDRDSYAEKKVSSGVRKEMRWKRWTKESYAAEFEKFLKDSIDRDRAMESRKRQHDSDDLHYQQKKEMRKEKQKEKKVAERKAAKDMMNWQNWKWEQAKEKLIEDFKKTNIKEEPQKIQMIDKNFGIFASKKERKKMERERHRSVRSLEEEANWINTMEEEARAAQKAKAEKERLAKEEKLVAKSPKKDWKDKRAEKKAAREEKDKHRLKLEKKYVEVATQTDRVRILPWIDSEDEDISDPVQQLLNNGKQSDGGVSILTEIFPHLLNESKIVKKELQNKVATALPATVGEKTSELPPLEVKSREAFEKKFERSEAFLSPNALSSPLFDEVTVVMNGMLDKLEPAEDVFKDIKKEEDEVLDIVTVKDKQQQLMLNQASKFQNALKPYHHDVPKSPKSDTGKPKNVPCSPKSHEAKSGDEKLSAKKERVHDESSSAKAAIHHSSSINPPVSKEELNKSKAKHTSSINPPVSKEELKKSKTKKDKYGKKASQRNLSPEMDYYGAPLTRKEAEILSRLQIIDNKPKVSTPQKQADKERYKNDPKIPTSSKKYEKKGRYDYDSTPSGSSSRSNQNRSNTHVVFPDNEIPDTPASPDLPPVVSRALTEDEAKPNEFLVPVVDDRKMPDTKNFAAGITPFQYDNLEQRTGRLDKLEELIKSVKKD